MFFDSKEAPTGSTELGWLRKAGARGGRQFFQVVKNETLSRPLDSGTFPSDDEICSHMELKHSKCPKPERPPAYDHIQEYLQFEMEDFRQAMKAAKRKAGQGLPPFIIVIADKFHQFFLSAINEWLINGLPEFITEANLWLLFKSGDRLNPTCYRPISIPHPLYNILAKLILTVLYKQVNPKLFKNQYGFRKGYSCTEAVIAYRAQVRHLICQYPDEGVSSLFIDISKAFDSVPHDKLFLELGRYVPDKTLKALSPL